MLIQTLELYSKWRNEATTHESLFSSNVSVFNGAFVPAVWDIAAKSCAFSGTHPRQARQFIRTPTRVQITMV